MDTNPTGGVKAGLLKSFGFGQVVKTGPIEHTIDNTIETPSGRERRALLKHLVGGRGVSTAAARASVFRVQGSKP